MAAASLVKKGKRGRPNKRWTNAEVVTILNYLEESKDFEAPTAQIFYRKLLATKKINATWNLVRWKVRHLKCAYIKAKCIMKMELCDSYDKSAAVEEKIRKICPHYYRLQNIFEPQSKVASDIEVDIDDHSIYSTPDESLSTLTPDDTTDDMFVTFKSEELSLPATEHSSNEGSAFNSTAYNKFVEASASKSREIGPTMSKFPQDLIKLGPKSTVVYLVALQAERITFQKRKLEFEKQKFKREFEIAEKRLNLEAEKLRVENELRSRDLELQILKIEQYERIQRLESEKRERLDMYELELKYKNKT